MMANNSFCLRSSTMMANRDLVWNPYPDMASRDPARPLNLNPGVNPYVELIRFLNWCQEQGACFTMLHSEYRLYARLMFDYRNGHIPYDEFRDETGMLLRNPYYEHLRVGSAPWYVHRMEVIGMIRMVINRSLHFPLALWVALNFLLYFALVGDSIWESYLFWRPRGGRGVRQRRRHREVRERLVRRHREVRERLLRAGNDV